MAQAHGVAESDSAWFDVYSTLVSKMQSLRTGQPATIWYECMKLQQNAKKENKLKKRLKGKKD